MSDTWYTFPAQMGEHRVFISFNQSYSTIAETDPRRSLLKVRVPIKNPNDAGMPTNAEFPALASLDEKLDAALSAMDAAYVGRLTVNGHRYFYFYVSFAEEAAADVIARISHETGYALEYEYEQDEAKEGYWHDIYPTADDWQVIEDLEVLDALRERGDKPEVTREVLHWAYFSDQSAANTFAAWARENSYDVTAIERPEDEDESGFVVRFSHMGTMALDDITHHTIAINRKAIEMEGDYDGWETSVEQ